MRTIVAVVSMLRTSFVALAAFSRVDPAMTSGPTPSAMVRSTNVCSSAPGSQVTKMMRAPAFRAAASPPRTNGVIPLAETPTKTSRLVGPQPRDRPGPRVVAVLRALAGLEPRRLAAGHDALHELRRRAEGGGHFGGFEHAEAAAGARADEHQASPFAKAWVIMSTARAIRSRSRPTAASIFRSSASITSMMSADASLSMSRLAGLMASVGSCCHLDWSDMAGHPGFAKTRRQILAPGPTPVKPPGGAAAPQSGDEAERVLDQYLDHLRVERRLAANTVESYARDLGRLAAFARDGGRSLAGLSRPELEAFVRHLLSDGLSPRSAARAVASTRGFYRFLVREGRIAASPAEDLHGGRPWPALPRYLSPDEVDRLIEQPDTTDAPRRARPGPARAALRHGPAGVGTGGPQGRRHQFLRRLPDDARARAASSAWCRSATTPPLAIRRYQQEARPAIARAGSPPRLFVNGGEAR